MTAPTPEKIQRWECELGEPERYGDEWCNDYATMTENAEGEYVLHSDHLRHLKLAQIEALEEVWKEMPSEDFEEDEPLYRKDMVFLKIAALRKELGDE